MVCLLYVAGYFWLGARHPTPEMNMETLFEWYTSGETADLMTLCESLDLNCNDIHNYQSGQHCLVWYSIEGYDTLYDSSCDFTYTVICQY